MRAKTEQPHLTGDNYKLCARQMPRPSASRKTAFLPASCMRIRGIFPPLAYEKSPSEKDGTRPKELWSFLGRTPRMMEMIVHLPVKTFAVKVIGINKSGNTLAHCFWKLQTLDQGEQNDDAVTAALRSGLHVSLPGSATRLPPALLRSCFWLESLFCILRLILEENKLGELEIGSSLSSPRCLFPGSCLLTRRVQPRGLSLDLFWPTSVTDQRLAKHEIGKIRGGHDLS